ncbi:MAG: threonine-phosphate decarboxylase [Alphaproteobacteria bacterium]|nr:threonine-phosphate decarboxylase [Alphaproteobacteria bacterium]
MSDDLDIICAVPARGTIHGPLIPSDGPIRHGGDMAWAERTFGVPGHVRGWLDLSTGINPVPYPLEVPPGDVLARLPGAADMAALESAARGAYGVPDGAAIVAAPGTQALIQILPTLFPAGDVTIMGPTYGEHAMAWRAAGHAVHGVASICAQAALPPPYGVVVHPNNPDGRVQTVEGLTAFAEEMHERGGVLVVDEAFADVSPEVSVTSHADTPGLVVLRSFGKFFGLAGVRLGFAVTTPDFAAKLSARLGPWAVSGLALWAGARALGDGRWIEDTRLRLCRDAVRLDGLLDKAGLAVVGGTDLFRLVQSPDARQVFEKLARAGILARSFDDHPNWLRFGLPGAEEDWARLEEALS